jgi:hypothetical protein
VKGLIIYRAKCGTMKFNAAWVEWSRTFVGWMKVQPAIEGLDTDNAVGEVLGRPVFMVIIVYLCGHDAIDKLLLVLKNVAWDLGAADG